MNSKQAEYYQRALDLLGIDPDKVKLVDPGEYRRLTGEYTGSTRGLYLGVTARKHKVMWIHPGAPYSTYVHELLHIVFPRAEHEWIMWVSSLLIGEDVKVPRGAPKGYRPRGVGPFWPSRGLEASRENFLEMVRAEVVRKGLG